MESFDERVYVPILLTKRGERSALELTIPGVIDLLRPIFVVPEPDWDHDNNMPKKRVEDHVSSLPAELVKTWGTGDAFLDTSLLSDEPIFGGSHPLLWLADTCAGLDLELTPVVYMDSSDEYVAAAADIAARGYGACIRLQADHFLLGGSSTPLDDLLNDLALSPEEAHIVLDLADDVGAFAGRAALAEINAFPYLDEWASLTVAATAIPDSMPSGGSSVHSIDRQDWRIYNAICAAPPKRMPTFGDYGVNGAGQGIDLDPKLMSISATLRYACNGEWLISKGGLYKGTGGRSLGGAAVPPAAKALIAESEFVSGHCQFEDWIEEVASGASGGSNPEAWRKWGTLHHLQLVTEQVATLHGP